MADPSRPPPWLLNPSLWPSWASQATHVVVGVVDVNHQRSMHRLPLRGIEIVLDRQHGLGLIVCLPSEVRIGLMRSTAARTSFGVMVDKTSRRP